MSKGWDSGMLKKLKSLVGKGLSTSEMGKKLGMSKNAVVGKLNRLGWNAKATETNDKATSGETKKKTADKVKVVAKKEKVADVKKKTKEVAVKAVSKKSEKKTPVQKPVAVAKKSEKKEVNVQIKEIKTASKKTKKDLALHELLIQHALQMANLKPNQCRWPIGDPDSDNFHFCGETVFSGKPYCYEHCRQAYQFTAPKKK